jgi:hypothetical protein
MVRFRDPTRKAFETEATDASTGRARSRRGYATCSFVEMPANESSVTTFREPGELRPNPGATESARGGPESCTPRPFPAIAVAPRSRARCPRWRRPESWPARARGSSYAPRAVEPSWGGCDPSKLSAPRSREWPRRPRLSPHQAGYPPRGEAEASSGDGSHDPARRRSYGASWWADQ